MEFNTPLRQGMLIANICLECWANRPTDGHVAYDIVRKRREAAIDLFDLPHDILTHWNDVPEEKRPAMLTWLLQGDMEGSAS